MLILSRVCAEFHDREGHPVFEVTPATRCTFVEAPEAIREDPLFQLLRAEGSLEANLTPADRQALEDDPNSGADAEGKRPAARKAPAGGEKGGK